MSVLPIENFDSHEFDLFFFKTVQDYSRSHDHSSIGKIINDYKSLGTYCFDSINTQFVREPALFNDIVCQLEMNESIDLIDTLIHQYSSSTAITGIQEASNIFSLNAAFLLEIENVSDVVPTLFKYIRRLLSITKDNHKTAHSYLSLYLIHRYRKDLVPYFHKGLKDYYNLYSFILAQYFDPENVFYFTYEDVMQCIDELETKRTSDYFYRTPKRKFNAAGIELEMLPLTEEEIEYARENTEYVMTGFSERSKEEQREFIIKNYYSEPKVLREWL